MLDLTKIVDIEISNIDYSDYPDFSDAYISQAFLCYPTGGSRELTEKELDWLNEQREFVYGKVVSYLY